MLEKPHPFRSFGSDNNSGVHPLIMEAIVNANQHHAIGYGDDPWTLQAEQLLKDLFSGTCQPYIVFNGTGANSIAIQACTNSYHAVIVTDTAHILVDECGAPFKLSGTMPLVVQGDNGKLNVELIRHFLDTAGIVHHSQAKVIYLSQSTELGTVYTSSEIEAITQFAHQHDMYVIMDGARISNACVHLGKSIKELTVDLGVDILCFGGTKNGMMQGECVINFRPELDCKLGYIRKQSAQLASKMRYLAAQFPVFLEDNLYLKNAKHANDMATLLASECKALGYEPIYPVETNAVFLQLNQSKIEFLQSNFFFYIWDPSKNSIRLVCSWDTNPKDIEKFIQHLKK